MTTYPTINARPLIAAIVLAAMPAGGPAHAADEARLEQLIEVIEQQQRMIEEQAETLKALKREVQDLRQRHEGSARSVASEPVEVRKHGEKVGAADERAVRMAALSPSIPQTDDNAVRSGEPRISLTLSGQVNRALLAWSDGENADVFNVDNNNSGTRFRLLGAGRVTDDFSIGAAVEVQPQLNSSRAVSQNDPNTGLSTELRRAEVTFDSKTYGKLWLGKGWTASDSTSEVDLSGTVVVAHADVTKMNGGLLFHDKNTDTFGPEIKQVFTDLDGLGRQNRLRYDSPSWYGFHAAASWVSGGAWDVAGRYSRDFGAVKLAGALAYANGAAIGNTKSQVNGSFSLLHRSGLNLSGAAGWAENRASGGASRDDTTFWYLKGGYIARLFDFGTTNLSVDGGQTFNSFANSQTASTVGFAAVQNLEDYGTQIYLGVRWNNLDGASLNYSSVWSTMGGARVKF